MGDFLGETHRDTDFDRDIHNINIEELHRQCVYYSLSNSTDLNVNETFSVLHINARSLKNKMDPFLTFLGSSALVLSGL